MTGATRADGRRIGILECGGPPAELLAEHGAYDVMVRRMLGNEWSFRRYAVADGELPARVEECDGYVVTGSAAGVYEPLSWIPPLLDFLRRARGRAALVGICFGHQAMAQALGGRVEKSAKGWGIGLHEYAVRRTAPWMDGGSATVAMAASHQDQVVEKPPGAAVVLDSAFTPFAGLDYGDAVSFQFHPEFEANYARALIEARRERYGTEAADTAAASYAGAEERGADRMRVARWIGRFLEQAMDGERRRQNNHPS